MDYQKLAKERLSNHPFAQHMGLVIDEISEGRAVCSLEVQDFMRNPIGSIHGGVLYSLADTAAGSAAVSFDGHRVTTVDGAMHFLRAGLDVTKLIAEANVIKKGKHLITARVEIRDQDDTLLDDGTFTFFDLDT